MTNQQLKYRKHLRLREFDYNSNGAYFVTICTHNRLPIITDEYKKIIEQELIGLEERFSGMKIDYHVFMSHHIHFIALLTGSAVTISRIIQAFKSLTTLKIKRLGYEDKRFWQPNYYEHVIRNEQSLGRIRKYIVENPLAEALDWKEIEK